MSLAPPQFRPVIVRLPALGTYAALLEHVRTHVPRDARFIVLGESFSGPLAIGLAREHAERVTAVVLCNSFVAPPLTPLLRFVPWPLLFLAPPPRWVVRWFFVGRDAPRALVDAVRAAVRKTPRAVLAERMRSVFTLRVDEAPRLDVPVLALTSSEDLMVRANLAALERVASNVVARRIRGPHLLVQAAPQQVWAEIEAFLTPTASRA